MIDVGYLRLTPLAPLLVLLVPVSTGGGGYQLVPGGVPVFFRVTIPLLLMLPQLFEQDNICNLRSNWRDLLFFYRFS